MMSSRRQSHHAGHQVIMVGNANDVYYVIGPIATQ
jgi:hypothetical protein